MKRNTSLAYTLVVSKHRRSNEWYNEELQLGFAIQNIKIYMSQGKMAKAEQKRKKYKEKLLPNIQLQRQIQKELLKWDHKREAYPKCMQMSYDLRRRFLRQKLQQQDFNQLAQFYSNKTHDNPKIQQLYDYLASSQQHRLKLGDVYFAKRSIECLLKGQRLYPADLFFCSTRSHFGKWLIKEMIASESTQNDLQHDHPLVRKLTRYLVNYRFGSSSFRSIWFAQKVIEDIKSGACTDVMAIDGTQCYKKSKVWKIIAKCQKQYGHTSFEQKQLDETKKDAAHQFMLWQTIQNGDKIGKGVAKSIKDYLRNFRYMKKSASSTLRERFARLSKVTGNSRAGYVRSTFLAFNQACLQRQQDRKKQTLEKLKKAVRKVQKTGKNDSDFSC